MHEHFKVDGNELRAFDRIGERRADGKWGVNSIGGRIYHDPDCSAVAWVEEQLAAKAGKAQSCFVWVNGHGARMLWFNGVITDEHVFKSEACSRVLDYASEECFICRGVVFNVKGCSVSIDVLISKRDHREALSLVEGLIPEDPDETPAVMKRSPITTCHHLI